VEPQRLDTVLADTGIVAADACAATLLDLGGADLPHVPAREPYLPAPPGS
jgi:hypothetical protein